MFNKLLVLIIMLASTLFAQDIDWVNKTITTEGGAYGKNKLMAKRGAKTDARRNLIEALKEIRVDSKTTMRDLEVEEDLVVTQASGYIKQAWFDDNSINYTGSNALSCKVSFDKVAAKIIVDSLGIRTPIWQVVYNDSRISKFNPPYVVKPSRQGSSKGVSIVHSSEDFNKAFSNAMKYDSYAMIEEFIDGREITVGLIDGDALPIVEIKTGYNFYDYNLL